MRPVFSSLIVCLRLFLSKPRNNKNPHNLSTTTINIPSMSLTTLNVVKTPVSHRIASLVFPSLPLRHFGDPTKECTCSISMVKSYPQAKRSLARCWTPLRVDTRSASKCLACHLHPLGVRKAQQPVPSAGTPTASRTTLNKSTSKELRLILPANSWSLRSCSKCIWRSLTKI